MIHLFNLIPVIIFQDVPITFSDITKATKELNYDPKITLKEGLQRTYKWLLNNKNNNIIFNTDIDLKIKNILDEIDFAKNNYKEYNLQNYIYIQI